MDVFNNIQIYEPKNSLPPRRKIDEEEQVIESVVKEVKNDVSFRDESPADDAKPDVVAESYPSVGSPTDIPAAAEERKPA